jgi:hypothetical protein
LLAGFGVWAVPAARGDGGTLRYTLERPTLKVAVFTDPTPVRVGTVDVSVLVEPIPPGSNRPLPAVQICATPVGRPGKQRCDDAVAARAVNKLFRAAQLDLPEPGLWEVEVRVEMERDLGAIGRFVLQVEEGSAAGDRYSVWVGVPAVAVLVFAAHRWLAVRRQRAARPAFDQSADGIGNTSLRPGDGP